MFSSTLEQLKAEWAAQGWDLSALGCFRMEMAAPGAGDAGGQQQQGEDQGSGETDYSLGPAFLGRVPQEHRPILEPYVKQWDAGVTRRFQELHSKYAPFENMDPEQVETAMGLLDRLDSNPWEIYGILQQALMSGEYGPNPSENPLTGQPMAGGQQEQGLPGAAPQSGNGGLPPEVQQRLDQMQNTLIALGQHVLGQSQSQKEQQEADQLNTYLEQLHEEYGDFDDDWVLMRVYRDQSFDNIDQHISSWGELTGKMQGQQQQANSGLPTLLGAGGGNGPMLSDPTSVKNLSRKDTRDLVANILGAANNQQ